MESNLQQILRGSHVLRFLTTAVLTFVFASVPYTLVHGYAALPAREDRTVLAEMASLYNEDGLDDEESIAKGVTDKEALPEKDGKSHRLARQLRSRASAAEQDVTADMRSLEGGESRLAGLEARLKSEESLARKIESKAAASSLPYEDAASRVHDVLRYTLVAEDDRYNEQVQASLQKLAAAGYRVLNFRNAWGGKFYQGINVQLQSPAGIPVELQLHTPQSYAVKQASHGVYEIRRDPASTPEEVQRATRLSLAYNAQVRQPLGAEQLAWPLAS